MNTFAERLKYAMEQADLKQSALSEQAGISKAAISQYLSGKNTPNQERIKALADVTGVTFDFLMGYGAAPVTDAPPPVKKISVKEAARCMGKSDQFVRIGLQRGLLPFGNAVPGTGNNWNYYITATAKAVAKRTYEAAVELFASLCKQYNLDPMKDGVIISHKEGCVRGVASNHGDPEHLWNQLGTGYTMNGFRKAVQAAMKGGGVTTTPSTGNAATGGTGATVKPYLVRVTVSDLYIRKGPGTNYGKNGFIAPGVYTIVAESAGAGATKWGKLKSGAGWISLDYAKTV